MSAPLRPIAVLVLGSAISIAAIPPTEATPSCFGRAATIVGTDRDDDLVGTDGDDVIVSGDGWDTIDAGEGDDRICTGAGLDFVEAGRGEDRVDGGPDSDTIKGGRGADRIDAGAGSVEALFGGRGQDRLEGGPGGFDSLIGGPGSDLLIGGPDQDLAEYWESSGPVHGDLEARLVTGHGRDRLRGVEGLVGSSFDDTLYGDARSNLIVGEEGDDVLDARGSGALDALAADVVDGGEGDDTIEGGDGDDIITFEDSPEPVSVDLAAGTATGWGSDTVTGFEAVIGSDLDDVLVGDDDDNAIVGGAGNDAIDGAGGVDEAAFFDAHVPVIVDLAAGTATGWGEDTLTRIEDVTGTGGPDTITGDDGPNRLDGGSHDDVLTGASGDDVLTGGPGNDQADGGAGDDTCDAESETACEADPPA